MCFSVTARNDPKIRRACQAIPAGEWTPIRYPDAVIDDEQRWISDAQVAEVEYTA